MDKLTKEQRHRCMASIRGRTQSAREAREKTKLIQLSHKTSINSVSFY